MCQQHALRPLQSDGKHAQLGQKTLGKGSGHCSAARRRRAQAGLGACRSACSNLPFWPHLNHLEPLRWLQLRVHNRAPEGPCTVLGRVPALLRPHYTTKRCRGNVSGLAPTDLRLFSPSPFAHVPRLHARCSALKDLASCSRPPPSTVLRVACKQPWFSLGAGRQGRAWGLVCRGSRGMEPSFTSTLCFVDAGRHTLGAC